MTTFTIRSGDEVVSAIDIAPGLSESALPPAPAGVRRVAVITQPGATRVAAQIAESLRGQALAVTTIELPDRDAAKTLSIVERTCRRLNAAGFTRGDLVVGVGGGAITDVAGFIASVYLRGLPVWYVPTTLLGAVDAAIGGKTAVNVGGKNLAGTFRHPARVLIDPAVLATLPRPLLQEGAAEALKAGLIGDPDLVAHYETHGLDAPLEEVVTRAVAVKVAVVERDFQERGERAILNYGHTVGHGVESVLGIPHGHAVAIGMIAAGEVSRRLRGFPDAERQRAVIEGLGLPTQAPDAPKGLVLEAMRLDKKRQGDTLRFVVLDAIGAPAVVEVDDATVEAALAAVGIT